MVYVERPVRAHAAASLVMKTVALTHTPLVEDENEGYPVVAASGEASWAQDVHVGDGDSAVPPVDMAEDARTLCSQAELHVWQRLARLQTSIRRLILSVVSSASGKALDGVWVESIWIDSGVVLAEVHASFHYQILNPKSIVVDG